ncbi:MAG: flagellar motor switch protein FliN [Acidobacteriaceae bacterium]|nr:flagellar motor switch protein FliN [Acidobacteriaceae bacterium]
MFTAEPREELNNWIVQEWTRRFAQAIESMTGESLETRFEDSFASGSGLLWWEQKFGANGATFWVGAAESSWKEIGDRVLKAAGVDDGDLDSIKSTYQELVNQSLSGLGQSITNRVRRDVSTMEGREAEPDAGALNSYNVFLRFEERELPVCIAFSQELLALLDEVEPPKTLARPEAAPSNTIEAQSTKSLDLLLDVELPIAVSFGRAQLPLKEVIKLTTGSIIELNRSLSEPVEIIVNNCVVAKGQVVVVEGNFGVRIQQVISRQDRIRTLK